MFRHLSTKHYLQCGTDQTVLMTSTVFLADVAFCVSYRHSTGCWQVLYGHQKQSWVSM